MLMQLLYNFSVTNGCKPPTFFGIKPWYNYLHTDSKCNIINFTFLNTKGQSDIALIALAVVDGLLRIAAFVAIGYIIYGGILYVTSQGSPDQTQKAQSTIQNALIGLVIAIISVSAIAYFGSRLG